MTHPAINEQILKLIDATLKAKARGTAQSDPNAKLLAALYHLMFVEIPSNPATPKYRQGKTLGDGRKHWFRAKFGNGRFRLFYRYSSSHKAIIYAWVNDSDTLRTYGSKTDAYEVFKAMLNDGNPPDGWEDLMKACASSGAQSATDLSARIIQSLSAQD